MTEAEKLAICAKVAEILAEECGSRHTAQEIASCWPECREYRFQGSLGFGGKVWSSSGRVYVNCYPEHMTDERRVMIERANERLAAVPS